MKNMQWIIRRFVRESTGSVMMEYIIVTTVFLLGVGGLLYCIDGKYSNLFFGPRPNEHFSDMTLENLNLSPVGETSNSDLKTYGLIGNTYTEQTKRALKVIAMPVP